MVESQAVLKMSLVEYPEEPERASGVLEKKEMDLQVELKRMH